MADIARYPFVRHLRGSGTTHVQHIRNGATVHAGVGALVLVPAAQCGPRRGAGRRP